MKRMPHFVLGFLLLTISTVGWACPSGEKWQPMDLAEPEYTVEDTTELLKRLRETPLPYQVIQKNEKIIEI